MTVTATLFSHQGLDKDLRAPCGRYPRIMSSNRLYEFPAEAFEILVFCEDCGHRAPLDRSKVPEDLTIQELRLRLRCASCGSREASIRIVYTGAGGFHHGGCSMGSS